MNQPFRTKRSHGPLRSATGTRRGTAVGGLLLTVLLSAGCQSGGQQDLVAREMRQQEDQIYAMQNYLEDYQKLLCQYRADNAALKRQLSEGRVVQPKTKDDEVSPIEARPRKRQTLPKNSDQDFESIPDRGPELEAPPAPEIKDPDVPPLDTTKSSQADLEWGRDEEIQAATNDSHIVTVAAIAPNEEIAAPEPEPLVERVALIETTKTRGGQPAPAVVRSSEPIWIQGEVVTNDAGGGPRILVEVEPLESAMAPGPFVGRAELMLLNPAVEAAPLPVARWNFTADAVQAATLEAGDSRSMQFRLELPAGTLIDTPVELWVRLLPADGGKLLAHVPLNLMRAGPFTSIESHAAPQQDLQPLHSPPPSTSSTLITHHEPVRRNIRTVTNIDGDGWTTALPGEPSDAHCLAESQWRASSEPIPAMVQAFVPASPVVPPPPAIIPTAALEAPAAVLRDTTEKAATSQESGDEGRPAPHTVKDAVRAAARSKPTWSPTR